jgi:4-hydroxybenzoate polyprenyltransferase
MFCSAGLTAGGDGDQLGRLFPALVVVMAFLVFSVAVNDLADEAIDRVDLPGDAARALITGQTNRRQMTLIAISAGSIALAGAITRPLPTPGSMAEREGSPFTWSRPSLTECSARSATTGRGLTRP